MLARFSFRAEYVGDCAVRDIDMTTQTRTEESLLVRLHRALGPIAGGLILDFVDLVTFGPLGLLGGFMLGGVAAWWITSIYRLSPIKRLVFVVLAMAYTAAPLTSVIPLATLISACARFEPQLPETSATES